MKRLRDGHSPFGCVGVAINDGKIYVTGDQNIMFGDDILVKNWKMIASNVSFFNGIGNCYVDKDKNLWIDGNSKYCALGDESKNYKNIQNYIKCPDTNILGKVSECWNVDGNTYVLLDDNSLWATGTFTSDSTGLDQFPGWAEKEDKINFVKILDDVVFFCVDNSGGWYTTKNAITSDGKFYAWGDNYFRCKCFW